MPQWSQSISLTLALACPRLAPAAALSITTLYKSSLSTSKVRGPSLNFSYLLTLD